MAKGARLARIEGELQRVIAELVSRGVKDPRVGMITITAVKLAPDLSVARIFFLPFAGRHSADEVGEGLASAAGYMRGEVGRRLQLRHAPRLEFEVDRHLEQATHLTSLINKAVSGDRQSDDPRDAESRNDEPGDGDTPPNPTR